MDIDDDDDRQQGPLHGTTSPLQCFWVGEG